VSALARSGGLTRAQARQLARARTLAEERLLHGWHLSSVVDALNEDRSAQRLCRGGERWSPHELELLVLPGLYEAGVRRECEQYLAHGTSPSTVARTMRARGVPPPRGLRRWSARTVQDLVEGRT